MNIPYAADLITQYIPWYYLASTYLKTFHLPHWVDGIYGQGYPLLAQGETGVLSPINATILLLLPLPLAVNFLYLIYAILALLGIYIFLKESKLENISSILGGLIFILSGFMVSRYFQPSIIFTAALFPLGMVIVKKSRRFKNLILLLAPLIYLQVTAGHLQITLISIVAYVIYAFLLNIFNKKGKFKFLSQMALAIAIAMGLSAIQLMPTYRLFKYSERIDWDPMIRFSYSLPPSHIITYLLPNAYGVSKPGDDFGFKQFGGGFWELNLTIWTLPFLLSLLPVIFLFKNSSPKEIIILYILWVFSLLIAFGGFFKPNWIVAHIPNFPFRAPARFLLISTFASSCLAAFGINYLMIKLKIWLRVSLFIVVLVSIFIQQKSLLSDYFFYKDSAEILANFTDFNVLKLATPLPLKAYILQTHEIDKIFFQDAFQEGFLISSLSLIIFISLLKKSLLTKCRSFFNSSKHFLSILHQNRSPS